MIVLRLIGVLLFVYLVCVINTAHSADNTNTPRTQRPSSTAQVTIREIGGPIDHNHCTTRQFQHMSFHHEGVWFVFYSDGKNFQYQTSDDSGKTWKRSDEAVAPAPNGSSSFDVLQVGDTVYVSHAHYPLGRYDVNAPYAKDPARRGEYTHEGRIKKGRIEGRRIKWLQDVNPGFTPDYCNLVRDSRGFFWVFTREDQVGTAHRSVKPNDIQSWVPKSVCLPVKGRHALDAAALDNGRLFAASLLTTDGKLYGNLYDGETWGASPILIAEDLTTVAGDDRRLAVEFDPTKKRLHLIYVDAGNRLRYRQLDSPYRPSDWQPALSEIGTEIESGVFTAALSVDSASRPYGLVITYGMQKYLGTDKRRRTGELYARRFDGQTWQSDPIFISQPGTINNWYPNVNQDAKDGLCVLYSRSIDTENLGVPLAVMASLVSDLPFKASHPAAFLNNGVTAHRGNSGEFPENTIPAFQSGIDVGADWIELDIFRTNDGQLVVTHDRTTGRVGDRDLVVADSTYDELAKIDVATDLRRRTGKTVEQCPPQRMPLLRDVLLLVMKHDRTRVSIQPKMNCVADAVALVKAMKAEQWVGFNDGSLEYMIEVKRLAPDIPVFWDRGEDTKIDDDIAIATKHGFEALVVHHEGVTPEKVRKIKSAGIEVGAWTVNDRATMRRLLDIGVERIYTDHPHLLLSLNSN